MNDLQYRYIQLLKNALTDFADFRKRRAEQPLESERTREARGGFLGKIARRGLARSIEKQFLGKQFPREAETMVGLARLDNVQQCVLDVLERNVPGDLMETGVWRGGTTIFMRGMLKALNVTDRSVWVADSFEGLPPPSPEFPQDKQSVLDEFDVLRVSLDEVKRNFTKYDLLDNQVKFLKGFFEDTLATAPVEKLAVLRLDGDMYSSTYVALEALYHKLSVGGYLIVDDYKALKTCEQAVTDFRELHGLSEEIKTVDWTGAYWRKEKEINPLLRRRAA